MRSSALPGDHGGFQLPYLRFLFSGMDINDVRVLTAWRSIQHTPGRDRAAQIGGKIRLGLPSTPADML